MKHKYQALINLENSNTPISLSELNNKELYSFLESLDGNSPLLSKSERNSFGLFKLIELQDQTRFTNVLLVISVNFQGAQNDLFQIKQNLLQKGIRVRYTCLIHQNDLEYLYDSKTELEEKGNDISGEALKLYNDILDYYIVTKFSDLHITAYEGKGAVISVRIDGEREVYKHLKYDDVETFCRAIYQSESNKQKDNSFATTAYQKSIVQAKASGRDLQLRYQSMPLLGGFKVVIRFLDLGTREDAGNVDNFKRLEDLGYSPSHVQEIERGLIKPEGALVIAGITGSGKSTSLKNMIMWLNKKLNYRKTIYSIEDPIEYLIPGIEQVPAPAATEAQAKDPNFSTFIEPTKALTRADPDVIMIGEIRDRFTAQSLKQNTESGHKVLTTVHASSAVEIVKRLYGFNVSSFDMASPSFLSCLIYQKLMPLLCPHCKIPLKNELESSKVNEELIKLKNRLEHVADLSKDPIFIRNPDGCPHCNGRGAKGRQVCAEVVVPDLTLLTYFRDSKMIEAREYWRLLSDRDRDSSNFRGKTVLEHAIYKVRQGLISPEDVETELGFIDESYKEFEEIKQRNKATGIKIDTDHYIPESLKKQIKSDDDTSNNGWGGL